MRSLFTRVSAVFLCSAACALLPLQAKDARPALELARQLNEAFIDLAESVQPSVVVISVARKPSEGLGGESELPEELRRWLERYAPKRQRRKDDNNEDAGQPNFDIEGSGVILREEGYILTNNHVVEDAEKIRVRLKDGREIEAEIRGTDPDSDLAVIKLKEKTPGLVPVRFADSDKVRVGEFAIAVGAPFELDYTVTFGHVSAKGRHNLMRDRATADEDFIQTDANINPGNSGGPLVNLDGEVIGINSLIRGLNSGIGFAITANLAREVSDRLVSDGKFVRSWLGIGIRSLQNDPDMKEMVKGVQSGVVVRQIVPDGPASRSDLRAADIITAVDGKPMGEDNELRREISRKPAGKPVVLAVYRGEKTIQVTVRPEAMPTDSELAAGRGQTERPNLAKGNDPVGVNVRPMSKELAKEYGVDFTQGVMVTDVAPNGLGDKYGLKPGDIITDVNHQPVLNQKEFRDAVRRSKKGILLKFVRDGSQQFEVLKGGSQ